MLIGTNRYVWVERGIVRGSLGETSGSNKVNARGPLPPFPSLYLNTTLALLNLFLLPSLNNLHPVVLSNEAVVAFSGLPKQVRMD